MVNTAYPKPIISQAYKPFDDPDYHWLLQDFRRRHAVEHAQWLAIERERFEQRRGYSGSFDQALYEFIQSFIVDRIVDEYGGLGASVVFNVMRGHVLRKLIAEDPALNPAPGKVLITVPLTHSDNEQRHLAAEFTSGHPRTWEDWLRVERGQDDTDDPLQPISGVFYKFLRERCWVQTTSAQSAAFSRMRHFIRYELQRD